MHSVVAIIVGYEEVEFKQTAHQSCVVIQVKELVTETIMNRSIDRAMRFNKCEKAHGST